MASAAGGNGNGTKWEGYSNYELVSKRVSKSVSDAIDSYATVQAATSEGSGVPPELAADARADIVSAAMRLLIEMQQEQANGVNEYDEILDRWTGSQDEDGGRLEELQSTQLHRSVPGWLFQFVLDIRKAAWSLGYLQAGRRSKQEPDDPVEADVEAMFEGL